MESWFKIKKYPHIGIPPKYEKSGGLISYIKNPKKIKVHGFYPFIHKEIETRRFRRIIFEDGRRSKFREVAIKKREIYYANNIDSNIYSYYASILQSHYEEKLKKSGIYAVPTAYRTIPLNEGNPQGRNKCNIDFAEEVFNFIRDNPKKKLAAIAVDITGFFDNLDHSLLKKCWVKIMGYNENFLPGDHYNVFKNITKFSYIEEKEIFNEFKNLLFVESKSKIIKQRKVDRISYLKDKNVIAFCESADIKLLRKKNYIKANKFLEDGTKRIKGIPQGSPISSVLANIYMLDFDLHIAKYIQRVGGLFRRYSDDIVIIVPTKYQKNVLKLLDQEIKKLNLEIKPSKTQIFWFFKEAGRFFCFEKNLKVNQFQRNTMFDYLGFSFDGKYTYLKSSSLANYYRKMKKTIRRGVFFSRHTSSQDARGELFKRRLYKRFTYLGASRRKKYMRIPNSSKQWKESTHFDWGNYLSYAYMAARIMRNNKIKGQLRRHWNNFHDYLNATLSVKS